MIIAYRSVLIPPTITTPYTCMQALNTAGDNRIDLDELTSYWLGSEGYNDALRELAVNGGYGGFQMPPSVLSGMK